MGQYPESALPLACLVGLAPEGAAEPTLVPAERGLGLPPLAEHPLVPGALRRGANRRAIWPRYLPPGGPSWPRVLIGMTDDRMPRSSRA